MAKIPFPKDLINVIFGQVYQKLTNGGDPKMLGPENFIAWEPVATVIDEEAFDFVSKGVFGTPTRTEDMTDEEYNDLRSSKKWGSYIQAEEFARIADQIPSYVPELENGARKFSIFSPDADLSVSNVYTDLLEFCVVPDIKEDPAVIKKLERERRKIFKTKKLKNPDFDPEFPEHPEDNPKFIYQSFNSVQYTKYLEYQALHEEAVEEMVELDIAIANGDTDAMVKKATDGENIKKRVSRSLKRWETLGYKGKIEKIMNYIDEIESSNFLTIKKRYEDELAASKRTGLGSSATYSYTAPIPGKILESSRKWPEIKITQSSYNRSTKTKSHKWSAKGGMFGVFSVGTDGKTRNIDSQYDFKDFEMSFKITKCYISRPWMAMSFIKSKYWKYSEVGKVKFNDGTKVQMVSDGKGNGMLPAVTTELYFISDLKIGFKKGSNSYKLAEKDIKAGGGFRIGPWNLGSKYQYQDKKVTSSGSREGQQQTCSEILLIGRKCKILDLAPDPLTSIKDEDWISVS